MIAVVCLNPVIDRVYNINNFMPDKLYRVLDYSFFAGGKGVNVARVLNSLNVNTCLYGFYGGYNGEMLKSEIEKEGINHKLVKVPGETRTTVNIIDVKNNKETEIKESGPRISKSDIDILIENIFKDTKKGDYIICSGSIPLGISNDIYGFIIDLAREKGISCIIDTSGSALYKAVLKKPLLIAPNIDELKQLIKKDGEHYEIINESKKISKKYNTGIMLTMGSEGAYYIENENVIDIKIPKVEVVNSIGSGDAAIAGFLAGLNNSDSLEYCLKLAMACGISNACHKKVGYISKETILDLINKINIKKVTV